MTPKTDLCPSGSLDGSGEPAKGEPSWTPGPWSIEAASRDPVTDAPHFVKVIGPDDRIIASTWSAAHFPNARLIAAAPDLVDALAGMVGLVELIRARGDLSVELRTVLAGPDEHFRITDARAALAKARGQEPR